MDFSSVQSSEAAERLCQQGALEKLLLTPLFCGNRPVAVSAAYLPAGMIESWRQLAGAVERFFHRDLVNRVEVRPEYRDGSLVPKAIHVLAWHSEKTGRFEPTLEVW